MLRTPSFSDRTTAPAGLRNSVGIELGAFASPREDQALGLQSGRAVQDQGSRAFPVNSPLE